MKHILVTTDFSACSASAFATAKELQRVFSARLTIIAVVEPGEQNILRANHSIESIRKTYFPEEHARSAIIQAQKNVPLDIVEYAAGHEVDLIIIASHGRAGLKRLAFGSVTEEVLRTSKCPVLVVPYHARQKILSHEGLHILVTTDLSKPSEAALPLARSLIEAYGPKEAHLTVLHVVENILGATFNNPLGCSAEAIHGELEVAAQKRLESLRRKYLDGTLAVTCAIRGNKAPYQDIIDYADARDADMLIMATHGHSLLEDLLLGSVAEKLVRFSRRPVLVVPRKRKKLSKSDYEKRHNPVERTGR